MEEAGKRENPRNMRKSPATVILERTCQILSESQVQASEKIRQLEAKLVRTKGQIMIERRKGGASELKVLELNGQLRLIHSKANRDPSTVAGQRSLNLELLE